MTVSDNASLRELAKITNPLLRKKFGMILPRLKDLIEAEIEHGIEKWGSVDTEPGLLLNAALEELGEVAHAINHNEGILRAQKEIIDVTGILIRLYWMLEDSRGTV